LKLTIALTDYNDKMILVPTDPTPIVQERPVGQTSLILAGGFVIQVKETVEEVNRLLKEAAE
jgi:hypothetical protein